MKRIPFFLCFMYCCCNLALAQNSPKTIQDTAAAMKQKYEPVNIPDPPAMRPVAEQDTTEYNNTIYEHAIKKAEYQNRGAEDRRNPNSDDPEASPYKRVPDQKILPETK